MGQRFPILPSINPPTMVIGGEDDRIIGAQIQREMAQLIPNSRLKLYPGYGHGNDQENPDYRVQVERFTKEVYLEG
jgi:pimeloyl-ACP methyl ester carboxylesterase